MTMVVYSVKIDGARGVVVHCAPKSPNCQVLNDQELAQLIEDGYSEECDRAPWTY